MKRVRVKVPCNDTLNRAIYACIVQKSTKKQKRIRAMISRKKTKIVQTSLYSY